MENSGPNWEIIEALSTAPDSQLDKSMCDKLKEILEMKDTSFTNKEIADKLLYILDMCVYSALASGIVIQVIDAEWKMLGGTVDSDNANCPWRNKM